MSAGLMEMLAVRAEEMAAGGYLPRFLEMLRSVIAASVSFIHAAAKVFKTLRSAVIDLMSVPFSLRNRKNCLSGLLPSSRQILQQSSSAKAAICSKLVGSVLKAAFYKNERRH